MPLRHVPLAPFPSCILSASPSGTAGGLLPSSPRMVRLLHLPVFNRNDGCAFRQACRAPLQLSVVRQRSPLAAGCTARPWCHMTVRVVQWFAAAGEREARGEDPGSSIGGSSRGCSMARPLPLWSPITVCSGTQEQPGSRACRSGLTSTCAGTVDWAQRDSTAAANARTSSPHSRAARPRPGCRRQTCS